MRTKECDETVSGEDDGGKKGQGRGQSIRGREGRSKRVLDPDETTRNRKRVLSWIGRPSRLLGTRATDVAQMAQILLG